MEQQPAPLRFVLLEHLWKGVHWDFMLEVEGGLRTWAIDEPVAAGKILPARELPDHRAAYLDYEGPVSRGRGTVSLVDRGTYVASEWTADRVLVRIDGSQLVGDVILWRNPLESSGPGGTNWKFRLGNVD
jgi:DNA polymerase Ligase (LigD)